MLFSLPVKAMVLRYTHYNKLQTILNATTMLGGTDTVGVVAVWTPEKFRLGCLTPRKFYI